ncbi:nuclear transport factor 2 family protein [Antrihabitans sp. NCIMB 15449]|jgi:ketosteroid isomerase-like protein|uniref:Nuclear transport factor 2 family protein n=1 Tax=Antrihabitans spumae TaxID=3373370 RepID=A0ABW7JJN0_9NOCA
MTNDVDQPIRALLDATNSGDVAAFLDSFTADGVVDDWGREFRGREEIKGWSDREFLGKQVTLEVTGVEKSGGETTLTAAVGGNGFNGPSTFVFVVDGDKLDRMNIRA